MWLCSPMQDRESKRKGVGGGQEGKKEGKKNPSLANLNTVLLV